MRGDIRPYVAAIVTLFCWLAISIWLTPYIGAWGFSLSAGLCALVQTRVLLWHLNIQVSFFRRWYDLWIGAYYDQKERALYVCPLPIIGVKIQLSRSNTS